MGTEIFPDNLQETMAELFVRPGRMRLGKAPPGAARARSTDRKYIDHGIQVASTQVHIAGGPTISGGVRPEAGSQELG